MMIRTSADRAILFLGIWIFCIAACVSGYGQTFTCSPCSVSVTGTGIGTIKNATPYPSTLTVSGLSGTVATVTVQLQGLTTVGGGSGDDTQDLGILLKSPGGQLLEILGNTSDSLQSLSGLTLNISDAASNQMPNQVSPWSQTTGTLSVQPASYSHGVDPETFPSPGPGTLAPGSTALSLPNGTGTLNSTNGVFTNVNPNGTWSLYFIDNKGPTANNVSISGWSLTFTVNAAAVATSTVLSSNLNPSFTAAPNGSVTLTATVSSTSTPSGGTVNFLDGGSTISGCGSQAINGSAQATCTTTLTSEGNHLLTAAYSGSGSFSGSTTPSALNQFVKNHSTLTSGKYCNTDTLTAPGNADSVPDPSIVNVGTDTTGIPNAVSTVSVFLNSLVADEAGGIRLLLEAPSGQSLEFWGSAGDFTATSGNFSFSDTATSQLPQSGNVSAGSYQPTAYTVGDTFLSGPAPAPQAPNTFSVAAPAGNPTAATLLSTFNGATANGDWKLFAFYNGGLGHTLTIGNWCLDITPGTGAVTTTTVASSLNPATTSAPVTITATVQSSSSPVSIGTVTFTENGQPVTGASPSGVVAVNSNGKASITTSSLGEGDHTIEATYNDTSNTFNTSLGSMVQREDNATPAPTVSSNTYTYCNSGKVTIPGPHNASDIGAGSPNPSNIFVSGAPGTINKVTVTLNSYLHDDPSLVTSLLVGPLGTAADSLDFFSAAGGTTSMSSAATLTFDDAGSSQVSQTSDPTAGIFKPTSYGSNDTYTQSLSSFFTLPAGPYQYAAPSGATGLSLFSNQNPNGTWSLYFNQTGHHTGGGVNNGWCLNLTVNPPDLAMAKSHVGNFKQGETGAQYTLTVSNNGPGASAGTVTVTDNIPSGLTATAISGTNWNCTLSPTAPSCTRSDALAQSSSYDPITVTVSVANNAASSVNNTATLTGGGDNTAGNDMASDSTTIVAAADLTVTKTHTGNFTQGDTGDTYTITVTNNGPGATDSAVNVQDSLPTGLTATAMSGTGWTCNFSTQFCTRSDVLAESASYPVIALTVDVAANAAASVTNSVTVAGGGEINTANDTATDPTTINPGSVPITITTSPAGLTVSVDSGAATASPVNTSWVIGSSHTIATTSPQAGTPGTQFVFTNWSDAGAISHSVITPSTTATYTASFATQFQLTTAVAPAGGGTVTPASGQFFAANTVVPVTATANAGFTFANWTGPVASPTSASTTVTMSQAQSVTANFTANVAPALTSGASTTFTVGVLGSFTIGTSGSPTASVTEIGALPSGVNFHDNGNGTATLSGTPAGGAGGVYSLVFTAQNGTLPNATQNFTLTVNQAPAFTSTNSAAFMVGTAGSFTISTTGFPIAAITETGALPGGVNFLDNGNGTATLSGIAIASGTLNISVSASNSAGNATQNFALIVSAKVPTITALTSSANPSSTGQSVTLSAVVSSGAAGTPTGTVIFMDDAATLGSAAIDGTGAATFATSTLDAGTHNITAVYGGDAVFAASTSTVLSQAVSGPANFALSTSPTTATIQAGGTATFTITASAQNGFNSAITLACVSGAPSLSACKFSSNPITPGASPATSTLTITTTDPVATNSVPKSGRHSLPLYGLGLLVPAVLLGSVRLASQDQKKFFSFILLMIILGGCMFPSACLAARNMGGNASSGTPPGTYTITVTGTSGATQNTIPLTLTVQ